MKFFLDTEFIERGPDHPVVLISIGIVSKSGATFYAVNSEFKEEDCNDWLKFNVLRHLGNAPRTPLASISFDVAAWVARESKGSKPEFWGYYADYDWVVFAQMFGSMIHLPKGWPMYCRDIKQFCDYLGNPELPKQDSTEHNALADAQWNKQAYEFLVRLLAAAEERARGLVEALEPFAKHANFYDNIYGGYADERSFTSMVGNQADSQRSALSVGHLRRAREALAAHQKEMKP